MSERSPRKEGPFGARKPHEPSRMRLGGKVTVQDVLDSFVSGTARIPSSTGTQIEIARQRAAGAAEDQGGQGGTCDQISVHSQAIDPWLAMERAEREILLDVGVIRCVEGLEARQWTKDAYHVIALQQRVSAAGQRKGQGELVVGCLRAFHEWGTFSSERALASVFVWSKRVCGLVGERGAEELAQEFRLGKFKEQRKAAANLYSDSIVVLGEWVRVFNQRKQT